MKSAVRSQQTPGTTLEGMDELLPLIILTVVQSKQGAELVREVFLLSEFFLAEKPQDFEERVFLHFKAG